MKRLLPLILLSMSLVSFASPVYCADQKKHDYSGHFGDMDLNDDDAVNWEEFKEYFSHAKEKAFKKADNDQNGSIDHDEWHEFKEHHGYGCSSHKE